VIDKVKLKMSYSDFKSLEKAQTDLGLTINETAGLFQGIPPVEISDFLRQTLDFNIPLALAINSEKARSEFIIAPILAEVKRNVGCSLFSGTEFNVDPDRGLTGYVDFLVSRDPEQLYIKAPAIAVIEAKKEDLNSGLGQCAATLVAAQIFNQRREQEISELLGVVTSGSAWKFFKLSSSNMTIDLLEYPIANPEKILGILQTSF
jgi:hypothetical protein